MPHKPLSTLSASDLGHARRLVEETYWQTLRGKRVFLTGGTGFVGKWLLSVLLDANEHLGLGCEVVVLSRNPVAFESSVPFLANSSAVQVHRGDVRTFQYPNGSFDCVVHAATDVVATSSPLEVFDTCVTGTRRVLDFSIQAGAKDFLLVSSGAVYGRQSPSLERLDESNSGGPDILASTSAYGEGKRVAEWLVSEYGRRHKLTTKVARCFAFVGPYLELDKHFAIGNFLRDAIAGQPIVIKGDGTPYRSYLYAADMAGWLWAILLKGQSNSAYNVGGQEALSIGELARRVVTVLRSSSSVTVLTAPHPGAASERYIPAVEKALSELELPSPIALDEAIRRTADWYNYFGPKI